jgi:hypothetical protein
MKNINWFLVRQMIGYGFDLARIFPLISKQPGTSKLIARVSSHFIEAPNLFWSYVLIIDLQFKRIIFGFLPAWFNELCLTNFSRFRLETAVQSILG